MSLPEVSVDVRAAEDITVVADPQRIEQVLENLLANAVKTRREAAASSSRCGKSSASWAPSRVSTSPIKGPGIPPELLPRLFQRFGHGEQSVGPGLLLAHEIVVAHGGELSAQNLPDGGACLTVLLPAV